MTHDELRETVVAAIESQIEEDGRLRMSRAADAAIAVVASALIEAARKTVRDPGRLDGYVTEIACDARNRIIAAMQKAAGVKP